MRHSHDKFHSNAQHDDSYGHGHAHGVVDPSITTSERGIWAIKWSFVGLFVTALFQVVVVWLSGSVALLADNIHNFGDAVTVAKVSDLITSVFWLVIPSLVFYLLTRFAEESACVMSMRLSMSVTAGCYFLMIALLTRYGIKL